jgi:hypothetical protein
VAEVELSWRMNRRHSQRIQRSTEQSGKARFWKF